MVRMRLVRGLVSPGYVGNGTTDEKKLWQEIVVESGYNVQEASPCLDRIENFTSLESLFKA